jgi:hypothetical protein
LLQVNVASFRVDVEHGSLVATDDRVLDGGVVSRVGVDGRHFSDRFRQVGVDGMVFGNVDVVDAFREGGDIVVLVDQVHDDGCIRAQSLAGRSVV